MRFVVDELEDAECVLTIETDYSGYLCRDVRVIKRSDLLEAFLDCFPAYDAKNSSEQKAGT